VRIDFDLRGAAFTEHLEYERHLPAKLLLHVKDRDGWACRRCNSEHDLELHHITFRSQGGRHKPSNLLTLCSRCHERVHRRLAWIYINENRHVFFGGSRADLYQKLRPYDDSTDFNKSRPSRRR
jgi:cytochrome c553